MRRISRNNRKCITKTRRFELWLVSCPLTEVLNTEPMQSLLRFFLLYEIRTALESHRYDRKNIKFYTLIISEGLLNNEKEN